MKNPTRNETVLFVVYFNQEIEINGEYGLLNGKNFRAFFNLFLKITYCNLFAFNRPSVMEMVQLNEDKKWSKNIITEILHLCLNLHEKLS